MRKTNYLGKGLWLLVIAGVIGYGVGLGIDLLVSSTLNFSGSVASAFALLLAVTAFFFRVYGYRGITRGLTWRVVGTLLGALFITGMARWSRTSAGARKAWMRADCEAVPSTYTVSREARRTVRSTLHELDQGGDSRSPSILTSAFTARLATSHLQRSMPG